MSSGIGLLYCVRCGMRELFGRLHEYSQSVPQTSARTPIMRQPELAINGQESWMKCTYSTRTVKLKVTVSNAGAYLSDAWHC